MSSDEKQFFYEYFYEYSQYFAIAYAKLYNCKICLWTDTDYYAVGTKPIHYLCHAFVQVCPNLYVDAAGAFTQISTRYADFDYNEANIMVCDTVDKAKSVLRKIDVPYTDKEVKHKVQQYLKNNVLCYEIYRNYLQDKKQKMYAVVVSASQVQVGGSTKIPQIYYYRYDAQCKNLVGTLKTMPAYHFRNSMTGKTSFAPAVDWQKYV